MELRTILNRIDMNQKIKTFEKEMEYPNDNIIPNNDEISKELNDKSSAPKKLRNNALMDKLLADAEWYTTGFDTNKRRSRSNTSILKREQAIQEKEVQKRKRQEEIDNMPEEEREKLRQQRELKRQKYEESRKRRREERQKAYILRRERLSKTGRKKTTKKDYFNGTELERLVEASKYFTSRGGEMSQKRESKPPVRFEPPISLETRYKLNRVQKKPLTRGSSRKIDNKFNFEKASSDSFLNSKEKDDAHVKKEEKEMLADSDVVPDHHIDEGSRSVSGAGSRSGSSASGVDEYDEDDEDINWFTTITEDDEIEFTEDWKIMEDFVYLDDIPSGPNIPAIQASSLCADTKIDHHFFKGQIIYLHYPLSDYKEEYSLFLPKSDTQFNPFDELGKIMELIAYTFFPERELKLVINLDNPADCIIGRFIRAFDLYDDANELIEKNIRASQKKNTPVFKRKLLGVEEIDFKFKNVNEIKIFNDNKSSSHMSVVQQHQNTELINHNGENIQPSSANMKNDQLLPTPLEQSSTPELCLYDTDDESFGYFPHARSTNRFLKPVDLLDLDGLKPLATNETDLVEGIKKCIDDFNELVDQLRNEGTTFNVIRSRASIPRSVIHELLNQCYSRTVLPDCRKLKGYKAFSSTTYGELMPSFLSKVYTQVGLDRHKKFIDLGSGVGNCVIQAALEFGSESFGVEIMKNASELADRQLVEFERRCQIWGIKRGHVKLFGNQSFTDSPVIKSVVDQCDVILINNYLFDYELNKKVVELLQDIKIGTKIISLKPIVPRGYTTSWNSSASILDRMKTSKHIYGENSVSWTFNGGYYYITEIVSDIADENFTVVRKRGVKADSEDETNVHLNVFTNNV